MPSASKKGQKKKTASRASQRSDDEEEDNDHDIASQEAHEQDADGAEGSATSNQVVHRSHVNNSEEDGDEPPPEDTLRILLATDLHVGYAESDHVRGHDSFSALEEILQTARQEKVDFLLLGGDLFHENKPSRNTMYRVMELFRKYCLGDDPIPFEIVSDENVNFGAASKHFNCANFEDPNFNIALPVFSIHGNHDDPSRESGQQDLSAMDILEVTNLINYFGRHSNVEELDIYPILLQKGITKFALYGMGSMRDQRLYNLFSRKKVHFHRPAEATEDWFNMLAVHQNRENRGRGQKNALPESVLPDFMDLVLWGHEHECLIDPVWSTSDKYQIIQPGSSVRTSLSEGEAKDKNIALLSVYKTSFKVNPIPLKCVRPFRLTDITLGEEPHLDKDDPNVTENVRELLSNKVDQIIEEVNSHVEALPEHLTPPNNMRLPLIRVRVEHTGFTPLNNQRFGSQFVSRVANPADILLWHKRRSSAASNKAGKGLAKFTTQPAAPEQQAISIKELVQEMFEENSGLSLFPGAPMADAVEEYVDRNELNAIKECVEDHLRKVQDHLHRNNSVNTRDTILQELETLVCLRQH
eukprot:gb/GECG01013993.1/.p1 GENE.gb/GECG01013993.1/~~gb/GECG01013993.1/.p1  ORF type:complete len:584 (+),score=86.48 gb/GECG01013993.1/:1-1752(+)